MGRSRSRKNSALPGGAIPGDLREARAEVVSCLATRCAGPAMATGAAQARALWSPSRLADECGVPVRRVLEVLQALRSEPWTVREGNELFVTGPGREKIRTVLDAAMATERAAMAQPAPKPDGNDLRITRIWGAKRVLADRVDNGLEVICQVQSSERLMPGMVLKGAKRGKYGVYSYYGRLPRRKGRW